MGSYHGHGILGRLAVRRVDVEKLHYTRELLRQALRR
jgi:hypothetical protein